MNVEKSDSFSNIDSQPLRILSDYEIWTSKLLSLLANETSFRSEPKLEQILSENERMIVVFSHASPLSWLPAPCLLSKEIIAAGGAKRTPIAVMDRFFYSVPGLKHVAEFISQSSRPLSFRQLVDHFVKLGTADLVVFPEGSNCFFGEAKDLQPFRSTRFVELAIQTKTPMLLCVHRGSENWASSISLSRGLLDRFPVQKWIGRRLRASERLTIPLLPRPMKLYSMRCELFRCESDDIAAESERVFAKMNLMLQELDAEIADDAL